jgi:hypothetical protein
LVPAPVLAALDATRSADLSTMAADALTSRSSIRSTPHGHAVNDADSLEALLGRIRVRASLPVPALHTLSANIEFDGVTVPLDEKNLLLRGSLLRNTDHVYALVLYTGQDTKVALNMRNPPSKLGLIEKEINHVAIGMFSALFVLVCIFTALSAYWQGRFGEEQWYMGDFRNLKAWLAAVRGVPVRNGRSLHTHAPIRAFARFGDEWLTNLSDLNSCELNVRFFVQRCAFRPPGISYVGQSSGNSRDVFKLMIPTWF